MINFTLYKRGLIGIFKPLIALMILISLYFTVIIYMYDPNMKESMVYYAKAMPGIFDALGMTMDQTTLVGHMQSYLYGFFMIIIPLILIVILTNKTVVSYVDKGSMSYLIGAPTTRFKFIFKQANVVAAGVLIFVLYTFILGNIMSRLFFPGELDLYAFLRISIASLGLQFLVSGICFLGSCIFNESRYSLTFGIGICLTNFILQLVSNAGDKFEWIKYATIYTLFDGQGMINEDKTAYIYTGMMFIVAIVLYGISMGVFCKKDLPI